MDETPAYLRPFLLDPPTPACETVGEVDLSLPAGDGPSPVVVLVHGGPIRADMVSPREWPAFMGYAALLAETGLVGAMLQHGFDEDDDLVAAAGDVRRGLDAVRSHPRVDPDRVALWVFSAGGALLPALLDPAPAGLRAVATTYAYLGEAPGDPDELAAPPVPWLVTRVEHEYDWVEESVAGWLDRHGGADGPVTVLDVAGAHHGFETVDHTDAARSAVRRGVAWLADALR